MMMIWGVKNQVVEASVLSHFFRHSVDSVASYSSQNHVDRIRTQNFSAASCHDEDFGSIKTNLFRRSSSNLEYPVKRPESVTSNTSSTRSRLREFVERKSNQDENKSAANTVEDIQYFQNPTESLEFDKSHSSLDSKKSQDDRPKKRKLTKKDPETKNKKQEKYQSKLAEYYKIPPVQLPQDEFYQHLTKSRAAEEFLQKKFPNSDTEVTGSYGRLCKHKETEGSNLRRSRSLAVIREETFNDLQIQNHAKNKRSQLIPRARLFDKPCFKDRLIGRAKYQTKEEVLEGIYIDSTVSCFGDISGQKENQKTSENSIEKEELISRSGSRNSKSVSGSWPNLNEEAKHVNLSEDSIGHSRNPSEIDSLDSNYVRKHYNFDAHLKSYNNSSPETERSITSRHNAQELYITTDDHDSERETGKNSTSPRCLDKEEGNLECYEKIQTDIDQDQKFIEIESEINLNNDYPGIELENNYQSNCDIRSVLSENDGTISSPPDSITSYISISIDSSTDRSQKLEHLANSLAEKIDEYCDSQFQENVALPSQITNIQYQKTTDDPIYTSVTKKTSFAEIKRDSPNKFAENNKEKKDDEKLEPYVTNTYIDNISDNRETQNSYNSSKNIINEPTVNTLIENQYYSLPDINISKCLRKSERIDAQLREEDQEDLIHNTYGINENHFREILSNNSNDNYGQLNRNYHNNPEDNNIYKNSQVYLPEYSEPELIENYTKLEDDLKSIITIESNTPHDTEYYHLDTQQNEREINEIEGTIRNNKLITKSESLKIAGNSKITRPQVKILKSLSNDNINKKLREKPKTGIKKHYSLRQRDPTDDEKDRLPSPSIIVNHKQKHSYLPTVNLSFSEQIKNHSLLSRVQSFKTSAESEIAIVPLSGHQTIVINPPLSQSLPEIERPTVFKNSGEPNVTEIKQTLQPSVEIHKERSNINKSFDDIRSTLSAREPFITIKLNKVIKATIPKLNNHCCEQLSDLQSKVCKAPSKLILKDNSSCCKINNPNSISTQNKMTRPQVIQVIDSTKSKKQDLNIVLNKDNEECARNESHNTTINLEIKEPNREVKFDNNNVKEKLNNAIKTDIEYQEKINSVKNYWSKLIENPIECSKQSNNLCKDTENELKSETISETSSSQRNINKEEQSTEISVGNIIKSLESVKIVDSVRKLSQTKLQLWKDETEKVKSDSEIEEKPIEKVFKENNTTIYDNSKIIKPKKKPEKDNCRDTPEIEIVELSSVDNKDQKTQATLIKAKGFDKGCDEFDHVRYKVMKSELFKNSIIANYRKEAQFDGLLQYLQDYSFQELLVNNNIVIIEPIRTKIEPMPRKKTATDSYKIPPTLFKKSEFSLQNDKTKNAIRRHFFYHPIRVNKEIIEEELPNPDTVKKVRNLFEDTLKMKSPMSNDPPLVDENLNITQRSASYRNLSEDTKVFKGSSRKKLTRHLTIDTNFGNKKWDNASLSSGVSSGDLSSNNEYDNEGLSPYSQKNNTYSSSEEYLCDSANQDFCCESQYVSPDILKKIRDCGTSVTYYGGKVLNSKTGSNVSPMTRAIMDEIKSLQKNCNRDCYSCQTKCKGLKCSCLVSDKHQKRIPEKQHFDTHVENEKPETENRTEVFSGFKFKLVKSNSCSSRLELAGTDESRNPRLKFRKQNSKEDPPLVCDEENSVKNKICRLESYTKNIVNPALQNKQKIIKKDVSNDRNCQSYLKTISSTQNNIKESDETCKNVENLSSRRSSTQSIKQTNDANSFEKKFYYVNDNYDQGKVTTGKFGEMVFEEFEVLESCYDSLNSNKSMT